MKRLQPWLLTAILIIIAVAAGAFIWQRSASANVITLSEEQLDLPEEVPPLPFANNPDPDECGIPQPWHSDQPGYVTGRYEGEMLQPNVYLYDGHLRSNVKGVVPHGAKVEIKLAQANPVLDYYLVRTTNVQPEQEGWIPAPFLKFEPVE